MTRPDWLSTERFRKIWQFLAVTVLALIVSLGSERLGWLQDYENIYYDYWHQLAGKRRDAQHAAVIAVDDDTLLQYKDDPLAFWQPIFAVAMQNLTDAGVKSIGLDFIYAVSAEAWLRKLNLPDSEVSRNYDSPFRGQLAQGNKILIAQLVETSQGDMEVMGPPQEHLLMLPNGAHDTGIANLYPDSDKLVRTFYPVVIPDPQFPGVGFAMQLVLRATGGDSLAEGWTFAGETYARTRERRRIGYVGPPGTMLTVSMGKLLRPDALADPDVQKLKGRSVIIAPNNIGTSDRHFSPYSRVLPGYSTEPMIGGEIHANAIETILSGIYPRNLSLWLAWPALVLVLVAAVAVFLRLHPAGGAGGRHRVLAADIGSRLCAVPKGSAAAGGAVPPCPGDGLPGNVGTAPDRRGKAARSSQVDVRTIRFRRGGRQADRRGAAPQPAGGKTRSDGAVLRYPKFHDDFGKARRRGSR